MTRVALAALLIVLAAAPAFAEPPTGFSEFAWGTSATVLREKFVPVRCRTTSESRNVWYSLVCRDYVVEGLNIPSLRLDFEPADSLAGYHMVLARGSYRAFRDLVLRRFGPPTTSRRWAFGSGAQMWWTWNGVSATLIERCDEELSCVEVRTAALDRRIEQIRARERRDSEQSF